MGIDDYCFVDVVGGCTIRFLTIGRCFHLLFVFKLMPDILDDCSPTHVRCDVTIGRSYNTCVQFPRKDRLPWNLISLMICVRFVIYTSLLVPSRTVVHSLV